MNNDNEKLFSMRHTATHVLMQALRRLYPDAVPGVGPAIDDGFYHDFAASHMVSEDDLPKIEAEMKKIIKEDLPVEQLMMSWEDADTFFDEHKYSYTKELAHEIKEKGKTNTADEALEASVNENEVMFYKQGEFMNMCKGPHIASTGGVGPFKLTKVAGAYWRGDSERPMMQRIYGVAFDSQEKLDEYLQRQEEARQRDHRKVGKEHDLFTFADLVGKGLPLMTAKGSVIRRELERFVVDEEIKRGYEHVYTPELAKVDLYRTSGHFPYYKEDMYPVMKIDDEELILRPMTCPHHFMLYKDKPRSYRELPMRIAELARLYRYEQSGELTGLIRVRSFCLADSHIVCREDQAKDEIKAVIDLIEYVAGTFGLEKGKDFWYRLSLGNREDDKKYFKADAKWDEAESVLRETLQELDAPFVEAPDEAAFYGPKIDVQMKNVNGKEDTAFTVQYDFCMPERFELKYINEAGEEQQPIVIHRSSIGAFERTIAFLIEHFAGAFPLWLAPTQAVLVPVGEKHVAFAEKFAQELRKYKIRVEVNSESETVGKKIRAAIKSKVPYMLVMGDKEMEGDMLSVRVRGEDKDRQMKADEFIALMQEKINEHSLDLV